MKSNTQMKLSGPLDANQENELRDEELQTVTGGSLYQACCNGTHIPKVFIS